MALHDEQKNPPEADVSGGFLFVPPSTKLSMIGGRGVEVGDRRSEVGKAEIGDWRLVVRSEYSFPIPPCFSVRELRASSPNFPPELVGRFARQSKSGGRGFTVRRLRSYFDVAQHERRAAFIRHSTFGIPHSPFSILLKPAQIPTKHPRLEPIEQHQHFVFKAHQPGEISRTPENVGEYPPPPQFGFGDVGKGAVIADVRKHPQIIERKRLAFLSAC